MRAALWDTPLSGARKIQALLTRSERRQLIILFVLMLIATLFEALSIGTVMSALALIASGADVRHIPVVEPLMRATGAVTPARKVVAGMLLMAVAYTAKNVYLAFSIWRQVRFTNSLGLHLSQRLFALYLAQPYVFHLERNSAHLVNNIGGEVQMFASEAMMSLLLLCSECLVLAALGVLMVSAEPAGVLIVGALLISTVWVFHRFTRARATHLGSDRLFHEERAWQHLHQGLGAAKEVILLGRAPQFLAQFFWHNDRRAMAAEKNDLMRQLPRLAFEVVAVVALVVLTLTLLARGRPVSTLAPTLGLFAAVAFRMLPSASRVLFGLQTLRYSATTVDRLYDEVTTLRAAASGAPAATIPMHGEIRLVDVTYTYATNLEPTLLASSMRIARGESVGVIGASGAGKSTLIDVLLGLLAPERGSVTVDGYDIGENLRGWQNQIGYVPQVIYIVDDSLRRNVAFGVPDDEIDEQAVERALGDGQLTAFATALPNGLDTILGERGVRISGGERQRIGIARALYHNPAVLVLDEATSSLDTETERGVVETVRELKGSKTIIIVSHRHSTIEHCDRVYELRQGSLAEVRASRTADAEDTPSQQDDSPSVVMANA